MRPITARVAVWLALALAASACQAAAPSPSGPAGGTSTPTESAASSQAPVGGPVLGGTLRAARAADVLSWDPMIINDNDSYYGANALFATLLKASPDGTTVGPYLADSFEHDATYTDFTFHLNPDAKFCDGSPITSEDVLFSWTRAIPSDPVGWMFPEGIKMDAPDPLTFHFSLPEANVAMPDWTTLWGMMVISKKYADTAGASALNDKPVGSGPFCLASWEQGSKITLERNKNFWLKDSSGNTLPYVDKVEWSIVPDANSRVLKLQAGEVDIAEDIPANQVEALKGVAGIDVKTTPLMGTGTVLLNMSKFSDPKVRQAVNYAVDKDSLIQIVLAGLGTPAYSFLSLGKYSTDEYGYHFNLDKAKELMAQSSTPNGFDVEYLSKAGDPVASQIGVVLKDQLAKIGINLTLAELEGGAYAERRGSGKFEMVYKLGTLDIFDSSENLNFDVNTAGFTNWQKVDPNAPAVWALAQKAAANPNETERAQQFNELQKLYMAAPPMLPLFNPLNAWATSSKVQGYGFLPTGTRPFDLTYLQP